MNTSMRSILGIHFVMRKKSRIASVLQPPDCAGAAAADPGTRNVTKGECDSHVPRIGHIWPDGVL